MELLFPGDPCPPRPAGPLEPSLRPHIQGVWVLPPGAWHQAHTPQRGNPDPSARSGPAHETPASTPTSLPAQAAFLHPSQVGTWAHVDPAHLPPPCNHSCTRTTSRPHLWWRRLLASSCLLPSLAHCGAHRVHPSSAQPPWAGGRGQDEERGGGAGRLRAEMEVPPAPSEPSPSPDSPRPWGVILVQGSQL